MDVKKLVTTKEGQIFVSIVLGFGIAACFRKVCKKGSCVVIKGPKASEITGKVYKLDDACYKYTPTVIACDSKALASAE